MAFLIELDVDEYGGVDADDSHFPVDVVDHDWNTPYPAIGTVVPFVREPGEGGLEPDIYWCLGMRDWVCSELAYQALVSCVGSDLHKIADGMLDGKQVFLVQAPVVIDVLDREASVIDKYPTYEALRRPVFRRSTADSIARRIFRVPGDAVSIFAGDLVKKALEDAGVKGVRFVSVDWADS